VSSLQPADAALIDELVGLFESRRDKFEQLLGSLRAIFVDNKVLKPHVHSMKWRVKDPTHLKDKLTRKLLDARRDGAAFELTPDNLFERINDLAGFRILHLYTRQFDAINKIILAELAEAQTPVIEGPIARTWDNESRAYFTSIGVETKDSKTLYTSVHYIVEANTKTKYTAEIQVRTLAEELWGEVDHTLNYPHESKVLACREQIKVLARVTSSCSRLVDSIFTTHQDSLASPAGVTEPLQPAPAEVPRAAVAAENQSAEAVAAERAAAEPQQNEPSGS
jgi:putative GTP pyrophosphokinase